MPYGTGLDTAFNQDEPQQNINTHPKKVKTPEGLRKVKDGALPDASASHPDDRCSDERVNSFSSNAATTRLRGMGDVLTHPQGYTGKLSDLGDAADVSRKKKSVDYDKIQHLKVGEMVAYTKGQGTIVRKDGAYVTIFNEDAGAYDQVHAGETYIPGDTISMGIMNQLWDQMNYETRMASLHKAEVQEPLHFVDRKWNELPSNLKDVIKAKAGKLPAKRNLNDIGLKDNDPQSETSNSFAENATRTRMSYPKETKDYDKIEEIVQKSSFSKKTSKPKVTKEEGEFLGTIQIIHEMDYPFSSLKLLISLLAQQTKKNIDTLQKIRRINVGLFTCILILKLKWRKTLKNCAYQFRIRFFQFAALRSVNTGAGGRFGFILQVNFVPENIRTRCYQIIFFPTI